MKTLYKVIFLIGMSLLSLRALAWEEDGAERSQISSLSIEGLVQRDVFLNFDRVRVETSERDADERESQHPRRASAFLNYVEALRNYRLVPRDEINCLFSMLPDREPRERRTPQIRFTPEDPCYPRNGETNLFRPSGMSIDDLLRERDWCTRDACRGGSGNGGGGVGRSGGP